MDVKEKAHKSVILRSARVLIVAAPSNAAPDKRASYGRPMQRRGPEGPNSSLMLWRRSEVRNLDTLSPPDRLATLPSAPRPCSEKPQKEEVVRV